MGALDTTIHTSARMVPREEVPVLVVVAGLTKGEVRSLAQVKTVVGKSTSAAIRLTDTGVSRRHAKLVVSADQRVFVHDLDSSNGTFVNGVRVEVAVLAPGDTIRFGPIAACAFEWRSSPPTSTPSHGGPLSQRQLEVATLASRGRTLAEIGVCLEISPRTVKSHMDAIYNRLGIGSRAELAVWVTRRQ